MANRITWLLLCAAVIATGIWVATPAARTAPSEDAESHLALCSAGDSAVILDRGQGKSWFLSRRGDGQAAWLPIPRLDSDEEAARWRKAAPPAQPPATGGGLPGAADLLKRGGYVAVPLDRLNAGYPAIEARINEKKVYLLMDTGSPATRLDRDRVGRLDLKWRESDEKKPVPGGQEATAVCVLDGLEVGPCHVSRLPVWAADLSAINQALEQHLDKPVDGVLGGDVLAGYGAVIDYPAGVLFLRARPTPK